MIAAVIQARLGSQRCKNKMLRPFAGTNLISLALEKFSRPSERFRLYFAAYDPPLIELGKRYSCRLLARDELSVTSERIEEIMSYLQHVREDYVAFVNPCCPFLSPETLEAAVDRFLGEGARSMTAVTPTHTWFYRPDGTPINFPDPTIINTKFSQSLLQVTHAFHIFDRKRFLEQHYFWTHGPKDPLFFETPHIEAVDVDTELDFEIAEALYRSRAAAALAGSLRQRLACIRLLVLDVDGVLTDAGMYFSARGEELKKFNTRDGMGIKRLRDAGIRTAIITGESSPIVTARAAKLGITEVSLGVSDKGAVLDDLLTRLGIAPEETAYLGDDVNDFPALRRVGLPCAVADARPEIRAAAALVTRAAGGQGAVRELAEEILAARSATGEGAAHV